jgi:hypothetical protein
MTLHDPTDQEEGLPPPPDVRSDLRDLLGALLLLAVSAGFAVASLRIPFTGQSWVWYTSPGIFALAMALCLGGCSLVVGCRGLRRWRTARRTVPPLHWGEELRTWGMGRFLVAVGIIGVYLLLLGRVPFLLASSALILVFGTVFREGNFLGGLRPSLIAAAIVVGFSMLIMKVFGIVFP